MVTGVTVIQTLAKGFTVSAMKSGSTRSPLRRRLGVVATAAALTAAPLAVVGITAVPAQAVPSTVINLVGINDFHGRINNDTTKWATNLETLAGGPKATRPNNSIVVGAGDLIGASEFASAVQNDQPTIDVMNAIGLNASAVGNHEFDKGFADLRDRVIGTPTARNAKWDYLGANVYAKGTQTPVLPEYAAKTIDGLTVAVVGAVTQETASLVSPAGITALDFGDPIAAVTRVANQLSDGNPANGEAQVIVASFHAGATRGSGSTYEAEVAKAGEFQKMATLPASVDAIFNGHTHQVYAWDAPKPGGGTRPILQTGEYAANVGQIQLTVDTATGNVESYTKKNVPSAGVKADLTNPDVKQVDDIVKAAQAYAKQIGDQPIGSVTADISRAYSGVDAAGKPVEDRGAESALGDLVANALRDGIPADIAKPDLGFVNPGGLRADLVFAGDTTTNPANTDGVVTYAEANNVLPFVNNVSAVDLTGAQIKKILEQQWQPVGSSRPYLHLGVSDNVQVTQDPAQAVGHRITSIRIAGKPMVSTETYTVSTFSFLAAGGDNFGAFTEGKTKDTGLVDRDLWIKYIRDHAGLAPNFAREQVVAQHLPAALKTGQKITTNLSKLDMTSTGAVKNTQVQVVRVRDGKRKVMKTVAVTNGSAQVPFTVPGASQVELVAMPSKTTLVRDVKKSRPKVTKIKFFPKHIAVRKGAPRVVVVVKNVGGAKVGGKLKVKIGAKKYFGKVIKGKAKVKLPRFTSPGSYNVKVKYLGNNLYKPAKGKKTIKVYRN